MKQKKCKGCGCTELDCSGCIIRTGIPCSWSDIEPDLCTACEELGPPEKAETPAPTSARSRGSR